MTVKKLIFIIFAAATVALSLGSCGSSRSVTASRDGKYSGRPSADLTDGAAVDRSFPTADGELGQLLSEARTWLGVPYRYGGNDHDGVDCSGFVVKVYDDALRIKLPRTSQQLSEFCPVLDRNQLRPGDLVFFDTSRDRRGVINHVGLYIGEGRMIHASSSKGVIETDLDNPFYRDRFKQGGRVVALSGHDKRQETAPLPMNVLVSQPATQPAVAAAAPQLHVNEPLASPDADARSRVLEQWVEENLDSLFVNKATVSASN